MAETNSTDKLIINEIKSQGTEECRISQSDVENDIKEVVSYEKVVS